MHIFYATLQGEIRLFRTAINFTFGSPQESQIPWELSKEESNESLSTYNEMIDEKKDLSGLARCLELPVKQLWKMMVYQTL